MKTTAFKTALAVAASAILLILAYQPALGAASLFALVPVMWLATQTKPAKAAMYCTMAILLWCFHAYRLLPDILLLKAVNSPVAAWVAAGLFCLWQALPYGLFAYCVARFNLLERIPHTLLAASGFSLLVHYYPSPLTLSPTIYLEVPLTLLQSLDIWVLQAWTSHW